MKKPNYKGVKKRFLSGSQRGFTLIELLVVIAIIAVLASLILAALSSAQKGARDTRRKSDIGQYQKALVQYGSDNADAYPAPPGNNVMTGSNNPYVALSANSTYMAANRPLLDPKNANPYLYRYFRRTVSGTQQFMLCATLERPSAATSRFRVTKTYTDQSSACDWINIPVGD